MSASNPRFLVYALVMSLVGCGGSSGSSGGSGGNPPTTITFTFNVPPAAVAYQIGAEPYTLSALTSGKLTFSVPSGQTNFSVAYLCPVLTNSTPSESFEYVRQASVLDGTSYTESCFQQSTQQTATATVQVNAAAIPGAAWVSGGRGEMPWAGSTLDLSMQMNVGTYDIPVSVLKSENFPDNYLALRILRAQTVPGSLNNGALVDFTAADEIQPQPISYANIPSGFSLGRPFVSYQTGGGAQIILDSDGPTGQYLAVPAAAFQSGDSYYFAAVAGGNPNSGAASPAVGVERYTSSGGPQSFTFPAPWSYAGPTAAALPTFNFAYSGFPSSSKPYYLADLIWNGVTGDFREINMTSTANYQNGSTAMTIPDISGVNGFLTAPGSGTVTWSADIVQGSFTATNPLSGTITYAGNFGTYVLP